MTIHFYIFFILAIVGLLADFVDTIVGGRGLLTIPALLSVGLPPHIALGSNKLASAVGVLNAVYVYLKKGLYQPKFWLFVLLSSAIGAGLGTIAIHFISANWLDKIISIILLILAAYMAYLKSLKNKGRPMNYQPPRIGGGIMGLILGFYDGFFGPGTGSFWTTALIFFFKLDLLQATAIAKLMNFISNVVATILFMLYGSINYPIAFSLMLGYILGAYFGAHSAIKHGQKLIKPLFLTVVTVIAIKLIWQYWN